MKKILSNILAITLAVAMLSACGSGAYSDPKELAIKGADEALTQAEEEKNNGTVTHSHTTPKLLDNTGDVYYLYTEVTSDIAGNKMTEGGIVVIKIEDLSKGKYSEIAEVPIAETDDEHINSALEICKQLYSNK